MKKNRFSLAPPFNKPPQRSTLWATKKRRRKGTEHTPIFFPGQPQVTQEETPLSWTAQKRLQSFLISQTGDNEKKNQQQQGTISMIELFDVLLAITSVLSLVTCTIWCNRCVLEWRLRRRARRRNPGMFRKPAPVTPTKHVVEKPEPLGATPEPEHIYMEIDLEQPPPWDSVAPPPYSRTAATQISYI